MGQRTRINVGEVSLAITEQGDGDLVVLLHGFPEHAISWRHQLPALAEAGFRAVAPDLRGFGDSDRPVGVHEYSFPKLVGDVTGLVRALGADRAHVVGHDWGGGLAWGVAALAPDVVHSLTILNCPHLTALHEERLENPEQQRMSWYQLLFQFEGVAEQWLADDDFRNLRRWGFGTAAPGAFSEEDIAALLAPLRVEGALTAGLNYYRANLPPAAWLGPARDIPPVTAPTLIIWGEEDVYLGVGSLERSIPKVAGPVQVERLAGVSHWVQQEVPDVVNKHLVAFLTVHRATVTAGR